MSDPILRVEQLCKRFGAVEASRNLTFDVVPGEIHALIGPNGAGKTTAINQLTGEIMPDSGRVVFEGEDITRMPVHKRSGKGLARSFQVTAIFERLSVRENLGLAVQAHLGHSYRFWRNTRKDPVLKELTDQAVETVGLEERAHELAGDLSHGEKRQLEVGMALASNPKLLLLDEPMAGMGPGGTVKLSELIQGLRGKMSILLVEHDMDVIFSLADRITVLVYGEAIATGTVDEIRNNSLVKQAYLGEEVSHA